MFNGIHIDPGQFSYTFGGLLLAAGAAAAWARNRRRPVQQTAEQHPQRATAGV